ncbi:GTP-binding protein GEM-like isoform X1 [Macrosteles quadrilineatus]|uniref:GTP-binding protein GEM-like isoform X1 n=1 Tax=Macrosteles quadrilineatus TaxID=74068 RepID=UPI0023E17839|nr:GTP-binding protein GEM-like isoform X1 [Macrosteles quadrilineatus]
MEQVLTAGLPGTPPPDATRRRRPAARSQSARLTGNKSIRRRHAGTHDVGGSNHSIRSGSSEPRLSEVSGGANESPSPGGFRRKGSTQRRVNSVYQRKSTAFLDVPSDKHQQEQEDEDSYRLRSFSFTSKGVVNRGDSFRRRRSRSNSLLPSSPNPEQPPSSLSPVPSPEVITYRVAMLGAPGVGKTALVSQFMTSECINAYDRTRDDSAADGTQEESVCIMLNGEESELKFINVGNEKGEVDRSSPPADAYIVMYSVIDKASFQRAEDELGRLQDYDLLRARPAILVANKVDLVRSRAVNAQDGKCLACTYRAKFIEISVGINHNVDELLVGILNQIRMKRANADKESGSHWYKSRGVVRASMKARQMFTWIFGKEDSKFKNCENLHVL